MTSFSIPFSRPNQRKLVLFGLLAIGVLALAAGRGTMAYFTTSTTSTGNVFTAGTLHLQASDNNEGPLASVSTSITFASPMKPGDRVYAPIEIDNVGTLDAKYGITYTTTSGNGNADQNLAPALFLAIRSKGLGAATLSSCTATLFAAALGGDSSIWHDSVRTTAVMSAAGQTIADVTTGAAIPVLQATHDILCLEVIFNDPGASNTYNNASLTPDLTNTTVTFVFDGLVSAAAVTLNQ